MKSKSKLGHTQNKKKNYNATITYYVFILVLRILVFIVPEMFPVLVYNFLRKKCVLVPDFRDSLFLLLKP
jgi:hypothetical protein